jgi:hypothetical protein
LHLISQWEVAWKTPAAARRRQPQKSSSRRQRVSPAAKIAPMAFDRRGWTAIAVFVACFAPSPLRGHFMSPDFPSLRV